MKSFVSYLLLVVHSQFIYAQTNIQAINKPLPSSTDNRWDINKYIWTYAHNKVSQNTKLPVDFNKIDNWQQMSKYLAISNNGKYFAYGIETNDGPYRSTMDSLILQATTGSGWRYVFAGSQVSQPGFFAANNKQYILQCKDTLYFIQLGSNEFKLVNNIRTYKTTWPINQWLAYQTRTDNTVRLLNLETGDTRRFENINLFTFDKANKLFLCETDFPEKKLIICNLKTGREQIFPAVISYFISPGGNKLIVNTGTELLYINFTDQTKHTIYTIHNSSDSIADCQFDQSEKQVIFMVKENTNSMSQNTIWYYNEGMPRSIVKVSQQTTGLIPGANVQSAVFTDNGHYIKLQQLQQPKLQPRLSNVVQLDVWSYKDLYLQSSQINALNQNQTYTAIIATADWQVKWHDSQIEQLHLLQGDHAIVQKSSVHKYGNRFWEIADNNNEDSTWLVSLKDGERRLLPNVAKNLSSIWFSPENNYLIYFDIKTSDYFSHDLRTGQTFRISAGIPGKQLTRIGQYVRNYKSSQPCGLAAWLSNDSGVLVYDNNDIWQLNLNGKTPAINVTNGYGFKNGIIFRLFNEEKNENTIPILKWNANFLIWTFHVTQKTTGFYRTKVNIADDPELLSMGPWFINIIRGFQDGNISYKGMRPLKALQSDDWIVQRQAIDNGPNYFATKDFKSFKRLTNLQPQEGRQWLTEELHTFHHLDGQTGQGILYKPDNFNPAKKYPVLIVFYGGYSNNMHQFPVPHYNSSAITPGMSPVWFTNNDYLVFTPDIYTSPFKVGPEAYNVIEGAANYLKNLPYVDASGLGCASHSWSAKLGAYLFTHSKSFGAMAISEGFLYGNMTNVALSIDENGNSKLEAVENGFLFGNLWENREAWLEQTTVLNVHKASSPLLLFCNKESTKEYLDQTQQLFTALWRLDKKAWWLKYDKGNHILYDLDEQKDYTVRYTQFFDHYLKKAPAPRWMTQGVPAVLKGIEARYELDPAGSCGKDCQICKKWNEQYIKKPAMFELPISEWSLDK